MADDQTTKQPTIDNADDAYLEGKARFDEWMQQFQLNWHKPQIDIAAKMLWNKQPDQVKNIIRQNKPKAAKQLDDLTSERM